MRFFFTYTGHRATLVIMSRENLEILWQTENLIPYRIVQLVGIAFLKIGSATASDHNSISSKSTALFMANISDTATSVPRCATDFQLVFTKFNVITRFQINISFSSSCLRNDRLYSGHKFLQ